MLSNSVLKQIDYAIKETWLHDIKKDYTAYYMLKEDSLKCCFYHHLRNKLNNLCQMYNLRIYSEYFFPTLNYYADLAIVQIDPNTEETYLKDAVIDVIAVIELKFTSSASLQTANWIKKDIRKLRTYIQANKLTCQFYLAIIYEVECSSLNWMDKRSTNNWASGYVTELNAGYIDGEIKFEINAYNNLNVGLLGEKTQ